MSKAWLFRTRTGGRLMKGMTHSLASLADDNFREECRRRNEAGDTLGPECFPQQVWPWPDTPSKEYASLPDIFFAGSFWIVSQRVANIFDKYELGGGHLYPVDVTTKDRETPIGSGPWYCWNFGNRKNAFSSELSRGYDGRFGVWTPILPQAGETVLSAAAIGGAAVWVDPLVANAVFMSGPLGDAINETRAGKHFRLVECRIVE